MDFALEKLEGRAQPQQEEEDSTLLNRIWNAIFAPLRLLLSETAQKAYFGTVLFAATSLVLLGVASVAFWLFYWEFIPDKGVERVIHLQFGHKHPHGIASFPGVLVSNQVYDISLILELPRTPANLQTGNFMLSLSLSSSTAIKTSPSFFESLTGPPPNDTLAHSSRPAILTYTSPITSTASNILALPLFLMGLTKDSEYVSVPMFEGIRFSGRGSIPQSASLIVEADDKMQFYGVSLKAVAKFGGLRWLMYNHRIFSFVLFTTIFWTSSMLSMGVVWLLTSIYMNNAGQSDQQEAIEGPEGEDEELSKGFLDGEAIKAEALDGNDVKLKLEPDGADFDPTSMDDLSDTSRTFPTLGRQLPLAFSGSKARQMQRGPGSIKKEDAEAASIPISSLHGPATMTTVEADVEDESGGELYEDSAGFRDSGIGTGREADENAGRGRASLMQRRKRSTDNLR